MSLAKQLQIIADGLDNSVCYDEEPGDLENGSLALEIVKLFCDGR